MFVQLKQGFSCERVEYMGIHVMDRTENHHREILFNYLKKNAGSIPVSLTNWSLYIILTCSRKTVHDKKLVFGRILY